MCRSDSTGWDSDPACAPEWAKPAMIDATVAEIAARIDEGQSPIRFVVLCDSILTPDSYTARGTHDDGTHYYHQETSTGTVIHDGCRHEARGGRDG